MKEYYSDSAVTIYHGDCRDVMRLGLCEDSVHALVTSPPYGVQRCRQYGGIPEDEYPAWFVGWMQSARRVMAEGASALINIREPQRAGEIADYLHRSRLALRAAGWKEIDELIWVKPDGLPVGAVDRPRRSWERILWFSQSTTPRVFPRASGRMSNRLGLEGSASAAWISGESEGLTTGLARCVDWVSVSVRERPVGIAHPAVFPPRLAKWMLVLVTVEGDTVLDPFMGSGTTLRAAKDLGRRAIGIEISEAYCEIAARRMGQEVLAL